MIKVGVLFVLIIFAYLGLSSLERRSLYCPDRQIIATPAVYRLPFEQLALKTKDGVRIKGWFIPAESRLLASSLVLLFCHGNAGNISHRLDKLQIFHKMGFSVLLFDYRGYGQSEGVPSEAGTYADADAAYQYLMGTQKIHPSQIILYGESLGCAVATEMARRHAAGALILESPFTSTVEMAKRVFPWLPVRWIIRNRYDNLSKMPEIKMPVLIMHSPQDEIVPFDMGRQLFGAIPGPKAFFELAGGHNDGFEVTGNRYIQAIASFIRSLRKAAKG
jgi:fermentation-respiration switch protein FrsA (DUF1100 family)